MADETHPESTKPKSGSPFPSGDTRRIGPPGQEPAMGRNAIRSHELPDEDPDKDRD